MTAIKWFPRNNISTHTCMLQISSNLFSTLTNCNIAQQSKFHSFKFHGSTIPLDIQIKYENLSPTWKETLILPNIKIHGAIEHIRSNPPEIYIEILDKDKVSFALFWIYCKQIKSHKIQMILITCRS